MSSERVVHLLLIGAGNVGRCVLELLVLKHTVLGRRYGVEFRVVGVSDTGGVAVHPSGLDVRALVALKAERRSVAELVGCGLPGLSALDMVRSTPADVLLEASPANLRGGQPGLSHIEAALECGMHVVTANKPPLVLAYPRLIAMAERSGVQLRFDATVAGGLPVVNLGERDLAGARIDRLEGILNLTTNYILGRMAIDGVSYAKALAEAQQAGHAETDPSLDVEGWDAAAKLVILAHSVLDYPVILDDVTVEGIAGVTPDMHLAAAAWHQRIKLLAVAQREDAGYRLSVGTAWLDEDHPLARLGPEQMGIVFHTDVCGVVAASIVEDTPMPTAFAMLRDLLCIYRA